jgi:hypothetical protein
MNDKLTGPYILPVYISLKLIDLIYLLYSYFYFILNLSTAVIIMFVASLFSNYILFA